MRTVIFLFLSLCLFAASNSAAVRTPEISSVADLRRLCAESNRGCEFSNVTATVASPSQLSGPKSASFWICASNHCQSVLNFSQPLQPQPGDILRMSGYLAFYNNRTHVHTTKIDLLGHEEPPRPAPRTPLEIVSGACDNDYVQVTGEIVDAAYDDIDTKFTYFTVLQGSTTVCAHIQQRPSPETLRAYVGAQVALSGFCVEATPVRPYLIREIALPSLDSIRVLTPPPADSYAAPDLLGDAQDPYGLTRTQGRHRVCGRVIAVWKGDRFLLREPGGKVIQVLTDRGKLPRVNTTVEVAGLPVVNAYNIDLTHAVWRPCPLQLPAEPPPTPLRARSLLYDDAGSACIAIRNHGLNIRLRGTIRGVSDIDKDDPIALLQDGKAIIRLHEGSASGAFGNLAAGDEVEVTGSCIMELDPLLPQSPLPRVKNVLLILHEPGDLVIVSSSSWWTPARLLVLVGILLAVLTGVGIWNLLLKRLSERRGRELADERIARVTSELKVMERTRLAVELHDTLSQNLTGITLEIQSARERLASFPEQADARLALAGKSLDSCRRDLRNCLRDLRSNALEKTDMNEAIRMTLEPHVGNTHVAIRFNVPRERLTDNAAHTILRIVRELVLNALRHGQATEVRVAGAIENDRLLFSVRDNGRGFDPANRPGAREGHFGLLGVRERVAAFAGKLQIDSAPGRGAHVSVSINLPRDTDATT